MVVSPGVCFCFLSTHQQVGLEEHFQTTFFVSSETLHDNSINQRSTVVIAQSVILTLSMCTTV